MTYSLVRRLPVSFALTIAGCSLVEPRYRGSVDVSATTDGIIVTNQATYAVQFHSIPESYLSLWDSYPCYRGERVLPGETRAFPWPAEFRPTPAPTRYQVTWWRDGTCSTNADEGPRGGAVLTR